MKRKRLDLGFVDLPINNPTVDKYVNVTWGKRVVLLGLGKDNA